MEWWQAVILGIVEGATEFLPVSSTGHLILVQKLMGMAADDAHNAYTIAIQGGAIIAVLGLYFARMKQMTRGLLGKDPQGLKLATNIIVAFIPTGLLALALKKTIEAHLLVSLWPTVFAWFVGGAVILLLTWFPRKDDRPKLSIDQLTWQSAVLIGVIQCVAMWPGTSRSLVVIAGGLLCGLTLAAAIEFSFLLGAVTLLVATGYEFIKHRHDMTAGIGVSAMVIGMLAAGLSAAAAVKWMIGYLNKHGMAVFGYYRVALAMVVMALILAGKIQAKVDAAPTPTTPTVPPAAADANFTLYVEDPSRDVVQTRVWIDDVLVVDQPLGQPGPRRVAPHFATFPLKLALGHHTIRGEAKDIHVRFETAFEMQERMWASLLLKESSPGDSERSALIFHDQQPKFQ